MAADTSRLAANIDAALMTLGHMRKLGVRSIEAYCQRCQRGAILDVDPWPDHDTLQSFAPKVTCTKCLTLADVEVRPNWREFRAIMAG